jgi:nicotinamidase-related amidase
MRVWEPFLSERDKKIFGSAGFGNRMGLGDHPALLIIDVNYDFCGHKREPIEKSVELWNHSCGEAAWDAIPYIQKLIRAFREADLPIIYTTTADVREDGFEWGTWKNKDKRLMEPSKLPEYPKNEIVREIAPGEKDIVIKKIKPSAFHGTPLLGHLIYLGVDSLLVCGTTTSGCVRASVIDGFSHNFKVAVVEEATFDRGEASHAINLFDMHQKYADVISTEEALIYVDRIKQKSLEERAKGGSQA